MKRFDWMASLPLPFRSTQPRQAAPLRPERAKAARSEIQSYEDFWPYYVSEHRDPTCRKLHFVGTSLVMAMATNPLLWPALPVAGYGFAWVGHFVFEKNRPATFDYPAWSLRADFRMWRKILLGQMDAELAKAEERYPAAARAGA